LMIISLASGRMIRWVFHMLYISNTSYTNMSSHYSTHGNRKNRAPAIDLTGAFL
jgi:hypothetical protein